MHLKPIQEPERTHLSHFHSMVSAYETNKETVEDLAEALREAIVEAREHRTSVIVEQDCLEHIFVVHPSGTISLYRQVGSYEVDDSQGF